MKFKTSAKEKKRLMELQEETQNRLQAVKRAIRKTEDTDIVENTTFSSLNQKKKKITTVNSKIYSGALARMYTHIYTR